MAAGGGWRGAGVAAGGGVVGTGAVGPVGRAICACEIRSINPCKRTFDCSHHMISVSFCTCDLAESARTAAMFASKSLIAPEMALIVPGVTLARLRPPPTAASCMALRSSASSLV